MHVVGEGKNREEKMTRLMHFGENAVTFCQISLLYKGRLHVDVVQRAAHEESAMEELKVWLIPVRGGRLWEHGEGWETTGFGLITHFL